MVAFGFMDSSCTCATDTQIHGNYVYILQHLGQEADDGKNPCAVSHWP